MAQDLLFCLRACNQTVLELPCFNECYQQAGWGFQESEGDSVFTPFWDIVLSAFLIVLSALFSGLTLGLMSLDKNGLMILEGSRDLKEREHAKVIAPVREKGNLLLCTLLLGNVTVNTLLAITMAHLTNGLVGFLLSTALIVLVGEILPQAICSRHGLAIGAHTIWVVKIVIFLFWPIAYPISLFLDKILGREMGVVYSQEELEKLIEIHVTNPEAQQESGLTKDDHTLLMGALEYKRRKVKEVMTDIDSVFMLEQRRRLDFQTLFEIYKSGFTRIPVYDNNRQNIVGILYAKDLILVDPQDAVEIRTIIAFHGAQAVRRVSEETNLDGVFKSFKQSYIHMLFAVKTEQTRTQSGRIEWTETVTGIITLEDVLEEIIKEEILDEKDHIAGGSKLKNVKRTATRPDLAGYMTLYEHDHKQSDEGHSMSDPEIQAITAFLSMTVDAFKRLPAETVLKGLVRRGTLIQRQDHEMKEASGGTEPPETLVVYKRGQVTSHLTLVLHGKLLIRAGKEGFESELGAWTTLGEQGLLAEDYVPDFSAVIAGPCRLLQIHRRDYLAALRLAQVGHMVVGRHLKQASQQPPHQQLISPMQTVEEGTETHEEGEQRPLLPMPSFKAVPLMLGTSPFADGKEKAVELQPQSGAILNRLTSLGHNNWEALEKEAAGKGFILRFDNHRFKKETTISIYTRDSKELLAHLTDTLTGMGLLVRSAKIYTEGNKVLDVFGVVKESGEQIPEEEWEFVRQTILLRVANPVSDNP